MASTTSTKTVPVEKHASEKKSFTENLKHAITLQFAPPRYLSLPTAGIDVSASGIKVVTLHEHAHGLELSFFKEVKFAVSSAPATDTERMSEVAHLLQEVAAEHHIRRANIELSEARGYLFEATVDGHTPQDWRTGVEQHLDEYVPLPPAEVAFDAVPLSIEGAQTHLVGIGYARRVVDEALALFESARIEVRALESETFALPRAILPHGDKETVLIIDIGKSSTKLLVVTNRLPRFATTLDIGGHALTLAVQKYFGVTEEEAKRVKAERGMVPGPDNDEYIAAMLSTVSAIREEIMRRIDYWDSRKTQIANYERISRAILVGGNATLRGLPEYLEAALKVPVELGDVFTNFAPRADWLPPLDYMESLAFGTAIGLALREYVP
jgi:type IV pilus assembly protein PilM